MAMGIYEKSVEVNRKLIGVLDDLLAAGNWEASLFLKATGKQVQELRNRAEQLLIEATGSAVLAKNREVTAKEGHIKAFISVYQAEGTNLQQWHRTLKSLTEYSITRPIYREEEHVKALIRSKADKQREGYVTFFLKEDDIIPVTTGREVTDRLGNELLTVKMNAVKLGNIIEFVHCDKNYLFQEDGLVLKNL